MQRHLPPLCHETAEYPDRGLVNSISAFLWLDGVDLLFDVLHLGGKDNLPSLVIYIVHQQIYSSMQKRASASILGGQRGRNIQVIPHSPVASLFQEPVELPVFFQVA
jgi:hypothetical protein